MGPPAAQATSPPAGLHLVDIMSDVRDFADTAALLVHIDLVVTVDTSVAHLAGALGRPVWMMARFGGCWRWMRTDEASPWYPTMRIFRQDRRRHWAPVVDAVAEALRAWAARR